MSPPQNSSLRLVLIAGSLRNRSTNEAVVRTAQQMAAESPISVDAMIYERMHELPHFNPDDDANPPAVAVELRELLESADAVLFSTPEYAGSLPGSFKNLLDWTVGGGVYAKPAAWINASAHGGAEGAHTALRAVLGFTGVDLVEDCCRKIAVKHGDVGEDGSVSVSSIREAIGSVVGDLVQYAESRRRPEAGAEMAQAEL